MLDKYLTIQQVSMLLQVHWQTVLNYIRSGELEAVKLDKGYRVSQDALMRFTSKRTTRANKK